VLRVFDITEGGGPIAADQSFDVEVYGLQGRWYLDLWRDNRTFVTQLGYRQDDGSLDVLAQSNEVSTPPDEPESNASTGQHTDPFGQALNTDWPGDHIIEVPSPSVEPVVVAETESKPPPLVVEPITLLDPEFPMPYWPGRSSMSSLIETATLTEAALAPKSNEAAAVVVMHHEPEPTAVAAGDASVAFEEEMMNGLPEEFPAAEQLVAAVQENRSAIDAFYEAVESRPEAAGAYPHEPSGYAPEPPSAPAHEPAAPSSSTGGHPAPLEQVLGLSSLELPGRDVLLEVNAELHVYGRSKPNTELTLYGQIVKTRPDGSFSVRRPLPHGAVILPLLYTKKGDGSTEV
jgi:hypothetical protein